MGTFESAAMEIFLAGWMPLPVRRGGKNPAVAGFTGWQGAWADKECVQRWMRGHADSNIAIRLPHTIIGIDVDAYDGKSGADTLASLGDIPATYITTSRDDGISGIRLFRVPPLYHDATFRNPGGGIDIITWYHRHILVSPSVHPGGRVYRWFTQQGGTWNECGLPAVRKIPFLNARACDELAGDGSGLAVHAALPDGAAAWLVAHGGGEMCEQTAGSRDYYCRAMRDAELTGGTHEVMIRGITAVLGDLCGGHTGANDALFDLRDAFHAAAGARRKKSSLVSEWRRAMSGAVSIAAGKIKPGTDPCEDSAGEWILP